MIVEKVCNWKFHSRRIILSDGAINVSDARVRTAQGRPARIDLRVEMSDADQLSRTVNQIRSMADVIDIARTGAG